MSVILTPTTTITGKTLQQYLTDVQRLLHDATNRFWTQDELVDYINIARKITASETGCTRRLAPVDVRVALPWSASRAYVLNDRLYPSAPNGYSYICTAAGTSGLTEPTWPTIATDTVVDGGCTWYCIEGPPSTYAMSGIVPGRNVVDILDIMLQYSTTTAYQLRYVVFSEAIRSTIWQYQMTGTPQYYTIHNKRVMILQWPAMSYPASVFDCLLEPLDLVNTTDIDSDLEFPFTDIVAYYAAYKAKMKDQAREEAEHFLNDYNRRKMQAIGSSYTRRLPKA